MSSRLVALAAALVAFAALAASATAAPPQLRVTEARVANLTVLPSSNAGGAIFGTVLAVDTSNSMAGTPLTAAWEAARGFAAGRNLNQRLGILTFNGSIEDVRPFTTSQGEIDSTLAKQPKTANGTHLYDGVAQAVALLRASGIGVGSIIVLTDGADVGSTLDLDRAIQTARDAHVRVFTVGLRSSAFHPEPLERLAASTGGTFAQASSPEDLAPIYKRLGLELSREYLVTYTSIAHPNRAVKVSISVAGLGTRTAEYITPPLPLERTVYRHSGSDDVWQSGLLMLAVALLVPALLAAAAYPALRRRGSTVRARVSDYVSMPKRQAKEGDALATRIFDETETALEKTRWWTRYKEALELAEIHIPPVQIIVGTLVATLFAAWVFFVMAGWVLAVAALAVPFVVRGLIFAKLARKRRVFGEQLPDNLDVLASALRAGHSLIAALAVVVSEAPEPSRTEFQRVVADEQLGVSIEDSLGTVAQRMKSRDILQVALVASIQGQAGGNAAEVLDRVTESIRERVDLRRLVRTLTAQGRLARWIVSALPVGLLVMISILNPDYIRPLFVHTGGRLLLAVAALMIIAGSVVIGKIVDIEI